MESPASRHLARRCALERDVAGWNELLQRHGARLERGVRRALRRAGAEAGAESVAEQLQEVYCRLLEHEGRVLLRFRGSTHAELSAYLGRVAETVVVDRLRAARAVKRGGDRATRGARPELERAPANAESPEESLLRRERRWVLLRRLRQLVRGPGAGRALRVLRLALLEGWTSREISAAFGGAMAPASVDALLYRLRRRLAAGGLEVPRRGLG
jgi:RNA polymerase sigma factor (sigma-70 family)